MKELPNQAIHQTASAGLFLRFQTIIESRLIE